MLASPHCTFILRPDTLELVVSTRRSPEPVAYAHEALPPGAWGPDSEDLSRWAVRDPGAIASAASALARRLGRTVRRAHLALDGALIRQLHLPLGFTPPRAELETAVRTELERYVVFAGAEVAFDFMPLQQEPESLSVLFAAMRQDVVHAVAMAFEQAGIQLDSVEPAAFALMRGLREAEPAAFAGEAPTGVLAVAPDQMYASTWREGALTGWRTIYTETAPLHAGNPHALREAGLELQRTVHDTRAERWLLVDVPYALEPALPPSGPFERRATVRPGSVGEWARGAAAYEAGAWPAAFNLLPQASAARPIALGRGPAIVLASAVGILAVTLTAGMALEGQVRAARAEITRLEGESLAMQARLTQPDPTLAAHASVRDGLDRASRGAALVSDLADATPPDVWMTRSRIEPGASIELAGVSLSRSSPLVFAKALGELAALGEVAMPELRQDELEGRTVYRFRLTATIKPDTPHAP